MNSHLGSAARLLLAAAALAGAACAPSRSPVEIDYTFGGLSCADAGVAVIQVDVRGEVLTPDRYSCADAGKGIDIGSYLHGRYVVTIQGFDSAGNLLYTTTQEIDVSQRGLNVFAIDVPPAGGSLTILWKFAGQTCAQSHVQSVQVLLDGDPVLDAADNPNLPCTQEGVDGTTITGIATGSYRVDIRAYRGGQLAYDLEGLSATIQEGSDTTLQPNVPAASSTTANASLRWTFAGMSCAEAKVQKVRLFVDGTQVQPDYDCSPGGSDTGLVITPAAGQHGFTIQGIRTGASGNQLVHQSGTVTATTSIGLTTVVPIDAAAVSPGAGGLRVSWGPPGLSCSGNISWTLKSPSNQTLSGTSACTANPGIDICNPGSAGCGVGSAGLSAGAWTLNATVPTTGGLTYAVKDARAPVPNNETNQITATFAPQ